MKHKTQELINKTFNKLVNTYKNVVLTNVKNETIVIDIDKKITLKFTKYNSVEIRFNVREHNISGYAIYECKNFDKDNAKDIYAFVLDKMELLGGTNNGKM